MLSPPERVIFRNNHNPVNQEHALQYNEVWRKKGEAR